MIGGYVMNLLPTATKLHRDLAYQRKKELARIFAKSKEDKWKYDNMSNHRKWVRKNKYKPIIIYTMDKLQNEIIKKYDEMSAEDQVNYLKESIKWHREVAHYHMYMDRSFTKQLEEHHGSKPEENKADSAPALAKQAAAEPQLAEASEAE